MPLAFLFVLIPICIQYGVYYKKNGHWGYSDIGREALNRYYYAQVTSNTKQIDFDSARVLIKDYSNARIYGEIIQNPSVSISTYFDLLKENMDGDPIYYTFPQRHEQLYLKALTLNHLKYYMHLIFLIPLLFLSYKNSHIRMLTLLLAFAVLPTGLSFKQGDRYAVPAVAIWSVLYPLAIFSPFKKNNQNIKQQAE